MSLSLELLHLQQLVELRLGLGKPLAIRRVDHVHYSLNIVHVIRPNLDDGRGNGTALETRGEETDGQGRVAGSAEANALSARPRGLRSRKPVS